MSTEVLIIAAIVMIVFGCTCFAAGMSIARMLQNHRSGKQQGEPQRWNS